MQMFSQEKQLTTIPISPINQLITYKNQSQCDQNSFLKDYENAQSMSIEILKENSNLSLSGINNPIQHSQNNGCKRCREWSLWAAFAQKKMLEIQAELIQKQMILNSLMKKFQSKISQQADELLKYKQALSETRSQFQKKLMLLKSENSQLRQKQKQFQQKTQKLESVSKENLEQAAITRKTIRFTNQAPTYHKIETLKLLKPNPASEFIKRSQTQQTVTDCSFINQFQNLQNETCWNFTEKNKNPEILVQKSCKIATKNAELEREVSKLKFENQNLHSYNKVLVEKLNNSKIRKY